MDCTELKKKIETFSLDDGDLGNQGYKRVLLQLFGYLGHGKSSFINSCKYVLNDGGPFEKYAEAGVRQDGGSMTMIRKAYELTPNITMVDNRGCNKITTFERAEVYAQLGNFYPLDQPVNWKENFSEVMSAVEDIDYKNTTDFLVPIYIHSALHTIASEEREDVRDFFENCQKMTGVVPIVVITRKKNGNFFDMEKQFRLMGAETVFAIENYTMTSDMKTLGKSTDILGIIVKALENVTFRLSLPRDPETDWKERRKFLYNYTHEGDLKEKLAKAERDRQKQEQGTMMQRFFQRFCGIQ